MSEKEVDGLMEKMARVQMMLHRYQAFGMRAFGPHTNPHRGQGRVLSILKMQSPVNQKEFSYLLDMRQQSLSELLAKLEQKGYITRTPSEEDRRTTVVTLTEAGKAAAEQTEQQEWDASGLFDCLTEEEQRNLSGYLDRLAEAMEQELDNMEVDWKAFGRGPGFGPKGHHGPPPHHGFGGASAHQGCGCGRQHGAGGFDGMHEGHGHGFHGMPDDGRFGMAHDGPCRRGHQGRGDRPEAEEPAAPEEA